VLARKAGDGSAQVDLDYVVPRYQGFTLGEFVYRPGGRLAARGYRRLPDRVWGGFFVEQGTPSAAVCGCFGAIAAALHAAPAASLPA
jgi:hypothetical protein